MKDGLWSVRAYRCIPLVGALVAGCGGESEAEAPEQVQTEGEARPEREGPEGCYIGAEMRCDCARTESECGGAVGGVWTEGCASCAVSP